MAYVSVGGRVSSGPGNDGRGYRCDEGCGQPKIGPQCHGDGGAGDSIGRGAEAALPAAPADRIRSRVIAIAACASLIVRPPVMTSCLG
jgi:hypothetical protein